MLVWYPFSKKLNRYKKNSVNTSLVLYSVILFCYLVVSFVMFLELPLPCLQHWLGIWSRIEKKDKSTIKKTPNNNGINYVIKVFIFWMKLKDKIKPDQCWQYQCLLFSTSYRTTHSKHVLSANTRVTIRASSLTARHCVIIHIVGNPCTAWIAICI